MSDYKNLIIPVIKWLAVDLDEVVIDIYLSDEVFFHTIEWRKSEDKVFLPKFISGIDIEFDFEDLDLEYQKSIYLFFMTNFLN